MAKLDSTIIYGGLKVIGSTNLNQVSTTGLQVNGVANITGTIVAGSSITAVSSYNSETKTVGTNANIAFSMLAKNKLYGLYGGVGDSGNVWLQVGRKDGDSALYDLKLQSLGGKVICGGSITAAGVYDANNRVYSETSRPTTLSGYGITDWKYGNYGNIDLIPGHSGCYYYTGGSDPLYTDGTVWYHAYPAEPTRWGSQLVQNFRDGRINVRGRNNSTWTTWLTVIDSGNITSQHVALADAVSIEYSNNSPSNYQMLWGSANRIYGTAGITCNPSTNAITATTFKGALDGNASGSSASCTGNAASSTLNYVNDYNSTTGMRVLGSHNGINSNGNVYSTSGIYMRMDTNTIYATTFSGNLTGTATITSLQVNGNAGITGKFITGLTTSQKDAGVYGSYDPARINHIWSMGSGYSVLANGTTFGSLYGMAYKHTNNTTGGYMAGGHQIVFCNAGTPGAAIGFAGGFWTSGTVTAGGLQVNGNATVTGTVTSTNFLLSSDRRLKENIKLIDLTKSSKIDLIEYSFKSDGEHKKRYGVIAQDIETTNPELVITDKDGMKSVSYIDLLILKVYELESKIKNLGNAGNTKY